MLAQLRQRCGIQLSKRAQKVLFDHATCKQMRMLGTLNIAALFFIINSNTIALLFPV